MVILWYLIAFLCAMVVGAEDVGLGFLTLLVVFFGLSVGWNAIVFRVSHGYWGVEPSPNIDVTGRDGL